MRWKAIFMALAFTDRASLWLVILPTWAPVLGAFSMACVCCDQGRQQLRGYFPGCAARLMFLRGGMQSRSSNYPGSDASPR